MRGFDWLRSDTCAKLLPGKEEDDDEDLIFVPAPVFLLQFSGLITSFD